MRDANCLYLFQFLAPVVQKVDSAIHCINHYPVDPSVRETNCVIHWIEIYPVGEHYPTFEHLGPDWFSVLLFVSVVIG